MGQDRGIPDQIEPMSQIQVEAKGSQGRRTERLMLEIPIRVFCFGGSRGDFTEETHTIFVNRDGALITLKHPVAPDETLRIVNLENLREADFRVVGSARLEHGEVVEWGVECLDKQRTLWDIDFPPPLDTDSEKAGALLECQGCNKQALRILTLTEVDVLDSVGRLEQLCDSCGELAFWAYADVNRRPKKDDPAVREVSLAQEPAKWDGKRERRLHKRVALKLPVLIRNDRGQQELGKTEDVSKGGFAMILGMLLAVGDRVAAVCPYTEGGQNIEQKAEVRRRVMLYAGEKWLYGFRYISL
jgi:PilZ domain